MHERESRAVEGARTRCAILTMPRLNANEDEARVVALPQAVGQEFAAGALLFTVETTKAANDVIAPCGGRVERLLVAIGDLVPVGGSICQVQLDADVAPGQLDLRWTDDLAAEDDVPAEIERHVSTKALEKARALGIDIAQVQATGGKVRVADVERHATANGQPAENGGAPAILHRFAASDAVIIGGSGHARTIMDAVIESGFRLIGAVDDAIPVTTSVLSELKVLGTVALLNELRERGLRNAFIGVGGAISNTSRRKVFEAAREIGFALPPLVARGAHLGLGSTLGAASYCLPGASVGPAVTIGDNCIVNQNVVVAHDSTIEDDVHLAPNAVVAGHCRVGAGSTIGMCATLINGCRVGAGCLIHNNVPVTSNVPDGATLTLSDVVRRLWAPSSR